MNARWSEVFGLPPSCFTKHCNPCGEADAVVTFIVTVATIINTYVYYAFVSIFVMAIKD